jgi:hypothetical protein
MEEQNRCENQELLQADGIITEVDAEFQMGMNLSLVREDMNESNENQRHL